MPWGEWLKIMHAFTFSADIVIGFAILQIRFIRLVNIFIFIFILSNRYVVFVIIIIRAVCD